MKNIQRCQNSPLVRKVKYMRDHFLNIFEKFYKFLSLGYLATGIAFAIYGAIFVKNSLWNS